MNFRRKEEYFRNFQKGSAAFSLFKLFLAPLYSSDYIIILGGIYLFIE